MPVAVAAHQGMADHGNTVRDKIGPGRGRLGIAGSVVAGRCGHGGATAAVVRGPVRVVVLRDSMMRVRMVVMTHGRFIIAVF